MTVIALLNHTETPILLSDMLLSADGKDSNIFLPTLGDLNTLKDRHGLNLPYAATRMVRKPFAVGNRSMVAWAGTVSGGKALQQYLQEHCADRHVTQEDLDTAIWTLSEIDKASFSVICVSLPPESPQENWRDKVEIAYRGCVEFDSKLYGKCFFGGSGASELLRHVQERDQLYAEAHGKFMGYDQYALLATSLCGRLLFRETLLFVDAFQVNRKLPDPLLLKACGGFFEAYTFARGALYAPKSTLYFCIRSNACKDKPQVTRIYYYSSRGDNAIILSLLAEPVDLDDHGHISLGDNLIDSVICPPFSKAKEHMHSRIKPSNLFDVDTNFHVDTISATVFSENSQLPTTVLDSIDEMDATEPRFRHQQFAFANRPRKPTASILFDNISGLSVNLDSDWCKDLIERFLTESTKDFHIETDED